MASNLLKIHTQSTKFPHPFVPKTPPYKPTASASATQIFDIPFNPLKNTHCPKTFPLSKNPSNTSKLPCFTPHSSLSPPTPPASREDAVSQAKTSLSTTLQKPLNNPKLTGKIKRQKQPRYRVEIPVTDDSPESLIRLALDVFGDLSFKRRGSLVKVLLIWPNPNTLASAIEAFKAAPSGVFEHVELSTVMTVDNRILNSADVAVFLAPSSAQLTVIKLVSDSLDPSPLVLFNPRWAFEEEGSFRDSSSFVGSFEVIYAFLGLEVRGILSKRKGVVFKYVKDGVVSSERWNVFVEEEGGGDGNPLKVVSGFKSRPSIPEVENVLYNLMAVNSPITKSAKFLRELVSNVTGKKSS